jgi:flavorubredoxin
MQEVGRTYLFPKDTDVEMSEIIDGIYRIAGFVKEYGITFNQFLIDDDRPTLIHTGPAGMYEKIQEKVKEVIPLEKLAYVTFLHFESDHITLEHLAVMMVEADNPESVRDMLMEGGFMHWCDLRIIR